MDSGEPAKDLEEKKQQPSQEPVFEQVISYNLNEAERPDGLKVRFKIKIASGRQAALLDERQAEAIRRLLEWTLHYRAGQQDSP